MKLIAFRLEEIGTLFVFKFDGVSFAKWIYPLFSFRRFFFVQDENIVFLPAQGENYYHRGERVTEEE